MKKNLLFVLLTMFLFNAIHAEITWNLSSDGTLTISGTDMPDYQSRAEIPWSEDWDNVKKIVIEDGVTCIGRDAFVSCRYSTSVTIPNSVTSIGYEAFSGCSSLTSITIPESVTSIGYGAFSDCSGLTSIDIPNSVTSIGAYAFSGCSGLTSFTIPSSVTRIEERTFFGCSSITSIIIPESVTSIGEMQFKGGALSSITNYATTPQEIEGHTFNDYDNVILHVLPGYKAVYEAANYWSRFTIVEDLTTGIDAVEGSATISEDKIFSISGQQLDKAAKGMNIINGKKVLLK